MTTKPRSPTTPSSRGCSTSEWRMVTPGERFNVRTGSEDTDGTYTVIDIIADPRNGVPTHLHHNEDEHFIAVEGTLSMAIGNNVFELPAGHSATVPKGEPHAWCNRTKAPVRFLVVFAPGGVEGFFRALGDGTEEYVESLAMRYGTEIVGPPMEDGIYNLGAPRA